MYRAVIVDDEVRARGALDKLLARNCPEVAVSGEADSVASALSVIHELQPDIIFLDIRLDDGSGFDLLDQLPDRDFYLIFVTAYDEFAIKAFDYNAVHYLLKPIDPEHLIEAVERIRTKTMPFTTAERLNPLQEQLRTRRLDRLSLPTRNGLIILQLSEIGHLESDANYTYFHTQNKERYMVSRPLRKFEQLLPSPLFFRTHQSHIVNIDAVRGITRRENTTFAVMTNGDEAPVSRRRRDAFYELITGRSL